MTTELIDETERMRRIPGIYFATEPSGRTAKIAGTGLGVWEVISGCRERPLTARKLARAFDWLTPAQLEAALAYYAAFPDEIDAEIAENDAVFADLLRTGPWRFGGAEGQRR
ncbi:MAG TPA: hypothetical protein VFD32_14100 [Dehalococcoidia bacterium]|nr:hypothetical protein [Dehalococcoidia bacterium]